MTWNLSYKWIKFTSGPTRSCSNLVGLGTCFGGLVILRWIPDMIWKTMLKQSIIFLFHFYFMWDVFSLSVLCVPMNDFFKLQLSNTRHSLQIRDYSWHPIGMSLSFIRFVEWCTHFFLHSNLTINVTGSVVWKLLFGAFLGLKFLAKFNFEKPNY